MPTATVKRRPLPKLMLDSNEVAQVLNVTPATVRRAAAAGRWLNEASTEPMIFLPFVESDEPEA